MDFMLSKDPGRGTDKRLSVKRKLINKEFLPISYRFTNLQSSSIIMKQKLSPIFNVNGSATLL